MTLALMAGLTALALSGIAGAQTAGPSGLPAPPEETKTFAKGKGVDASGGKFKFSARDLDKDPMTDEAKGSFSFSAQEEREKFFLKSEVQCLRVVAGRAHLIAEVTESNFLSPGDFVGVTATDTGARGGEGDTFRFVRFKGSAECGVPDEGDPIQKGNIRVEGGTASW